jgi:DNA-binding CsgD family transcriptional regulator
MSPWADLSPPERNVARLAVEGLSNRQIAERMSVTRHTVDRHLHDVFRKLDVNSRQELAEAWAREREDGTCPC